MLQSSLLPRLDDATPEGLAQLRKENEAYRKVPWPKPFDATAHRLHEGDAGDLYWLRDASVQLTHRPIGNRYLVNGREGE